jgi:hypothetical protein
MTERVLFGRLAVSSGEFTLAEAWRVIQEHRKGTVVQVRTNLTRHVYPRIGRGPIAANRTSELQAMVKALTDDLAPPTIEVVFTWVATLFKAAMLNKVVPVSPCSGVKLPPVEESTVTVIPVETVTGLADGIAGRYHALIVLGAEPACGFQRPSRSPSTGPIGCEGPSPSTASWPGAGREPTFWSDTWRAVAGPLGVESDAFHLLRHFYALPLIASGASVNEVQEWLCDTSALMTLDIYGHLWPGHDERTRAAIDTALAPLAGGAFEAGEAGRQ